MKIGIISDIHGDIDALTQALHVLEGATDPDLIICAGDLTAYGPYANEVIHVIRERDIPTVKGNHDSPSALITPENAEYLRQLPMSWRGTFEGVRLYMCHGVPGTNFMGFTPKDVDEDYIENLIQKMQTDIMIAGHTHLPHLIRVPSGIHFNPGSLHAIHRDFSSHTFAILTLPECTFEVWDIVDGTLFNLA